jgi:uncharacterized damage-inducible protein DinB
METQLLAEQLEFIFHGKPEWKGHAWHGPSVMETLRDVTDVQSQNKLPDSHSIIELVLHMTAWRKFVTQKLLGNDNYQVSEVENFPTPTTWKEVLNNLRLSQADLVETVKIFPESQLSDLAQGSRYKYNFRTMLQGIIHHDLYHIGQIALLKKIKS